VRCSRGRDTARDAHPAGWDGGKTRGVTPSSLWAAHTTLSGLITRRVPSPS